MGGVAAGMSVLLAAGASVTSDARPLLHVVAASASSPEAAPEPGDMYSGLIEQVHAAVEGGVEVPCVGPNSGEWTSDDPADQERAADQCWDCPLVFQCRAYAIAAGESAGVWGGFAPELERAQNRRPYRPNAEVKERAKERRRALRAARKAEARQKDCADAYAYILMEGGIDKAQIRQQIGTPPVEKIIATEIPVNTCACGTCHEPVGRKAMYRPGHDARHVSVLLQGLINEHADGRKVTKALIAAEAKHLPSERLRAKFTRAAERLAAKQSEADTKEAAK